MGIRLAIADSQEVVRLGVRRAVEATEIELVAEAHDVESAVRVAIEQAPDVMLLDVPLIGDEQLSVVDRVKQAAPRTGLLAYSAYDNAKYMALASQQGAAGYLLKSSSLVELVAALAAVGSGGEIWTAQQLRRVASAASMPADASDIEVALTARETEVLILLSSGMSNAKIADQLGISYETVKEHVQHLLRKIGVGGRTQAAVWAVRNGLV